ncbi:hypothetical protein Leryth_010111, partial [Lithospermum erythrorhizon]
MKLSFIPLEIVDDKLVVKYQSSDVMIGINRWKSTTFGYVLGINPGLEPRLKFSVDGMCLVLKNILG